MIVTKNNSVSTNYSLFEDLPLSIIIRDAKTYKLNYVNLNFLRIIGNLSKEEILNSTWPDFLNENFPNDAYTKKVSLIDNFIQDKRQPYFNVDVNFLLPTGYVWHGNENIKPMFNEKGDIISYLHMFHDIKINPIDLMSLYLYLHTNYKTGIQYFLEYLKIDDCFLTTPTKGELIVFLAKMFFQSTNEAAKYLKIQPESLRKVTFQLSKKLLMPKEVIVQRIFKYYGYAAS